MRKCEKMGQIEVYEFLKNKRFISDEWFSVADIEGALQGAGFTNGVLSGVRGDVIRLEWSGYLEARKMGKLSDWKRVFRLKAKYAVKVKNAGVSFKGEK